MLLAVQLFSAFLGALAIKCLYHSHTLHKAYNQFKSIGLSSLKLLLLYSSYSQHNIHLVTYPFTPSFILLLFGCNFCIHLTHTFTLLSWPLLWQFPCWGSCCACPPSPSSSPSICLCLLAKACLSALQLCASAPIQESAAYDQLIPVSVQACRAEEELNECGTHPHPLNCCHWRLLAPCRNSANRQVCILPHSMFALAPHGPWCLCSDSKSFKRAPRALKIMLMLFHNIDAFSLLRL